MALHVEEHHHPGAMERYQLARRDDPDCEHAAVVRLEELRRQQVLLAMDLVGRRLPPERQEALAAGRASDPVAWAFAQLLRPARLMAADDADPVADAKRRYDRVWGMVTSLFEH